MEEPTNKFNQIKKVKQKKKKLQFRYEKIFKYQSEFTLT